MVYSRQEARKPMTNDKADDIVIPELLPPSEDGVFKTLLTHPDAAPVLRDVVEIFYVSRSLKSRFAMLSCPSTTLTRKGNASMSTAPSMMAAS